MQLNDLLEVVTDKVVRTLQQQGFLNLTRMRNEKIRIEFRRLRNKEIHVDEAIKLLSEKDYFGPDGSPYRVGIESIRKIVYPELKKAKKK